MVAMVGSKEAGRVDGVFLAHMLVLAVLALVLYLAYVVVLDATMLHYKTKYELRKNEKVRDQIEDALKEFKELKVKKDGRES